MHHGIHTSISIATIAEALWEAQAILGGMDSSVIRQKATYSWILSTTLVVIVADAHGGGFLPPPAQYTEHSSKRPKGAAIYAGLHWISQLLSQFPCTHPRAGQTPALPVYVDNHAILKDIKQNLEDQTSAFAYTFAQIMISLKAFAPFMPNFFPSILFFPMLKATKTNDTHLLISLQQHKSIFWLINIRVPYIRNKLITLAYSQHGSPELGLLCTVVHIPSPRIYLPISVQQHTPLQSRIPDPPVC
jgi:hypothetical protein